MSRVERAPVLVMETGANQVSAGSGKPGWVSGRPSNLAAGGASVDVFFDLGPDWDQYAMVQVSIYPNTALTMTVQHSCSEAVSFEYSKRPCFAFQANTGNATSFVTSGSQVSYLVRPLGRVQGLRCTNTDGANSTGAAAKLTLAAYPN